MAPSSGTGQTLHLPLPGAGQRAGGAGAGQAPLSWPALPPGDGERWRGRGLVRPGCPQRVGWPGSCPAAPPSPAPQASPPGPTAPTAQGRREGQLPSRHGGCARRTRAASGPPSRRRRSLSARRQVRARSEETPKKGRSRSARPAPPARPPSRRWGLALERRVGWARAPRRRGAEAAARRWAQRAGGRGGGAAAPRSLASGDTRARPAERAGHVLPAGFARHLPDSGHSFPLKGSEVIINTNEPPCPAGAPRPELPRSGCPRLPWNANTCGGGSNGDRCRSHLLAGPQPRVPAAAPGRRGHLHALILQTDVSGHGLPPGALGTPSPRSPASRKVKVEGRPL